MAAQVEEKVAQDDVTHLPPAAAFMLGESTPGWRRDRERKAEKGAQVGLSRRALYGKSNSIARQTVVVSNNTRMAAARRFGTVAFPEGHQQPTRRKYVPRPFEVHVRYFDKHAIVFSSRIRPRALDRITALTEKWGFLGARFYLVENRSEYATPTDEFWRPVKALLERALTRAARKSLQNEAVL